MLIRVLTGVIIIIAIALGATFYSGYLDQSNTADSLAAKMQTDSKTLSIITNSTGSIEKEIADLNAQINQTQTALALENKALPEMTNTNIIVRQIITFGDNSSVTVIPLSTNDWASVKIDKNEYHVFRMSVEIKGSQQKVIDYVRQIQSAIDQYLVIEKLDLTNLTLRVVDSATAPTSAPIITAYDPVSAYSGEYVIITGSNFIGATGVSFGGAVASSYAVNSDTQITAKVGIGSTGNVAITNSIGTGSLGGFSYLGSTPPTEPIPGTDTKANVDLAIYAK
jgi:hypothetical protein